MCTHPKHKPRTTFNQGVEPWEYSCPGCGMLYAFNGYFWEETTRSKINSIFKGEE